MEDRLIDAVEALADQLETSGSQWAGEAKRWRKLAGKARLKNLVVKCEEAERDALHALNALCFAVDRKVADDVREKVLTAFRVNGEFMAEFRDQLKALRENG